MRVRNLILFVGVAGFGSIGAKVMAQETAPELVVSPVDKVYVPLGFDDNDDAEVILHGHFPSSCYKVGPSTAHVDAANHKIVIQPVAYHYRGTACIDMRVSFIQSIKIGNVEPGDYKIEVQSRPDARVTPLKINKSGTSDADDFLYASVDNALLETKGSDHELIVRGQHPYLFQGCVKLVELKYYMSPGDVMVVQPITRIANDNECDGAGSNRFEYRVPVKNVASGEYLIHVRVLDGNSVNKLVAIP